MLGSVRVTHHLGRLLTQAAVLGHDGHDVFALRCLVSDTDDDWAFYEDHICTVYHAVVMITPISGMYVHVDTRFPGNRDQPQSPQIKEQYLP